MMHFSTAFNHIILLFREWKVTSIRDAGGSFVSVLAIAVLFECIKALHVTSRLHMEMCKWGDLFSRKICPLLRPDIVKQASKACLFVTELCLAYLLMLIVMTYNTWFFVTVVIGHGLGYYLITPLIGSYSESEETGDYHAISEDSPLTRRKRQPLVEKADV